ncbi:protein ACCELERATED CELL DEATH 6-like [Camellia sinensis]|uniref:protein ACCELERATED CELL DEATH 6-like n=1 Tax=Camellia sinensis TaxID=4442 RepID=UPI001035AFB5|nr:protein ACCELERATED CELL DEATH 6-like [Camellia sinensis]
MGIPMVRRPTFDGDDYKYWSEMMQDWLLSLNLWDIVVGVYDENNREKQNQNAVALSIIMQSVLPSIRPKIKDATKAKEAWDILKNEYQEPTLPLNMTPLIHMDMRRTSEIHLLVATLVATVTFTAGFTIPGGYNGNEGPNQGMAILAKEAAFKAFVVTDTIALSFSISAVLLYFYSAITSSPRMRNNQIVMAANLVMYAMVAMVLAFITGTYVVLPHSSGLAISVCVIGCLPLFIFLIFVIISAIECINRRC